MPSLQRQLDLERLQRREEDLAEATTKVRDLENAKNEAEIAKSQLEASLQREIARLREEKDDQAKAIQSKFDALNEKLKQLQGPWWKKLLGNQ